MMVSSICLPETPRTTSLASFIDCGPHLLISSHISWITLWPSATLSTTRFSNLLWQACSAVMSCPSTNIFFAMLAPVFARMYGDTIAETAPNLVSGKPKNDVFRPMAMSQQTRGPIPSPMAEPFARQMVNCGRVAQAFHIFAADSRLMLTCPSGKAPHFRASWASGCASPCDVGTLTPKASPCGSRPQESILPSPVKTATRMSSRPCSSRIASQSAATTPSLRALLASGLLSVMYTMPSPTCSLTSVCFQASRVHVGVCQLRSGRELGITFHGASFSTFLVMSFMMRAMSVAVIFVSVPSIGQSCSSPLGAPA
mmetsp:Transcript_68879/g.180523  ORF Transcript_68879/g.180523 Transcript_68879/m.180523 type:complete len:313 (+) Transcript_68879:197-1135(+)